MECQVNLFEVTLTPVRKENSTEKKPGRNSALAFFNIILQFIFPHISKFVLIHCLILGKCRSNIFTTL
uniref:Uncharacterized protein n=1 Tax=Pararge aegeria TaxID=116150 RepID=S4P4L2_9NEOP